MTEVFVKKLRAGENAHSALLEILDGALQRRYGLRLSELTYEKTEKGKPYFAEGKPFFNFSDSGEYVACALSDCEVGVDIEKIREISDALCTRFLGGFRGTESEKTAKWTRYESMGKMIGCGIPHGLKESEFVITGYTAEDYIVSVCTKEEKCSSLIVINVQFADSV